MNFFTLRASLVVAILVLSAQSIHAAAPYVAIVLHSNAYNETSGYGNSATNQVGYGSFGPQVNNGNALLWTGSAGSLVNLNPPGYLGSQAFATDGLHQVGLGVASGNLEHAILWSGTAASFVDLNPAGFFLSRAYGVSGGTQVGEGTRSGEGNHALLWNGTAASAIDLHPPTLSQSSARDVSGNFQVGYALGSSTGQEEHAWLWNGSAASGVDLNPVGYSSSYASGISGTSQVGFGRLPGTAHALLWHGTAASAIDLNPAGFAVSDAVGVLGSQQVGYGYGSATANFRHALLWNGSAGSVIDLHQYVDQSLYTQSDASHIAPDGTIVGSLQTAVGSYVAVIWVPVPEPATFATLACAIVPLLLVRARRRRQHAEMANPGWPSATNPTRKRGIPSLTRRVALAV